MPILISNCSKTRCAGSTHHGRHHRPRTGEDRTYHGKIDQDPEGEEVKHAERNLWNKIYKKSGQGRRTGVGITAEGDMLAALGLRYGTEEATEFSEKVHKTVALGAYRSSVEMAKERGASKYTAMSVNRTIRSFSVLPRLIRNCMQK